MNFESNEIFYISTKKRFFIAKIQNITNTMKNVLNFARQNATITQKKMTIQTNKHRKLITYNENDII